MSHLYEQHKLTAGDALGQPRLLGVGERKPPPGGIYGKPSGREPEPCVGELIKGWYTPEQQAPDADLGKSLREGFRNTAPAGRVSWTHRLQGDGFVGFAGPGVLLFDAA